MFLVSGVDPVIHRLGPLVQLGRGEPQTDLVVGALDRVRAVADVATDLDREVASDGARGGVGGVGGAKHHSASFDNTLKIAMR